MSWRQVAAPKRPHIVSFPTHIDFPKHWEVDSTPTMQARAQKLRDWGDEKRVLAELERNGPLLLNDAIQGYLKSEEVDELRCFAAILAFLTEKARRPKENLKFEKLIGVIFDTHPKFVDEASRPKIKELFARRHVQKLNGWQLVEDWEAKLYWMEAMLSLVEHYLEVPDPSSLTMAYAKTEGKASCKKPEYPVRKAVLAAVEDSIHGSDVDLSALISMVIDCDDELREHETNETIGMSAEEALCDVYKIKFESAGTGRTKQVYIDRLKPLFCKFKTACPHVRLTKHIGAENKDADFEWLDTREAEAERKTRTLSLKTCKRDTKVCPQSIGQIGPAKWDETFDPERAGQGDLGRHPDRWKYIKTNIDTYVRTMWEKLFCCDTLLYIANVGDGGADPTVEMWDLQQSVPWADCLFRFSRSPPDDFGEAHENGEGHSVYPSFNTNVTARLEVRNVHDTLFTLQFRVGELQFHGFTENSDKKVLRGRNIIKFRFDTRLPSLFDLVAWTSA